MTQPLAVPTPELAAELRALATRRLSAEEFDAYANAPMSDAEREEIASLIDWFTRRYDTAAKRLAYARRASRRSAARMPSER